MAAVDGKNKRNKSTHLVASNSGHLWLRDTSKHATLVAHFKAKTCRRHFLHSEHTLLRLFFPVCFKVPSAGQHLEVRAKSCVCMYLNFFSRLLPHHIVIIFRLLRLFFPSTASIRGGTGGRETEWMGRMVGREERTGREDLTFYETFLFAFFPRGRSRHARSSGLSDSSTRLHATLESHFTKSTTTPSMTLLSDTQATPCFNRNGTSLPTVG